jgi:TctA family transporter
MKLLREISIDERTRGNARYAAGIVLGVTQILLAGVLFFRLYILGQADSEVRDIQAVLAISILGYIASGDRSKRSTRVVEGGVRLGEATAGPFRPSMVVSGGDSSPGQTDLQRPEPLVHPRWLRYNGLRR